MGISRTQLTRQRARLREVYKLLATDPKNPGLIREHNEIVDTLIMVKLQATSDKWKEWI